MNNFNKIMSSMHKKLNMFLVLIYKVYTFCMLKVSPNTIIILCKITVT